MTSNPTNVGHACELVVRVYIEDIFDGQGGTEEVSTSGMNDTLRLPGGARSLHIEVNQSSATYIAQGLGLRRE